MTNPAQQPSQTYGRERSLRRRAAAFVISVLINLLILWVLLKLAPAIQGTPGHGGGTMTSFNVTPDANKSNAPRAAAHATKAAAAKAQATNALPKPIVQLPVPQQHTLTPLIELSSEEFRKTDIGKIEGHAEHADAGETGASGGGSGGDSELAGGSGPNGEPLYRAEWYREPTDAELRFYLPKNGVPRGSWAEIACQTMPRFHVDNCIALGDSPPGSHLAGAIQQAGWQFLVRPPRVGGKSLVGAWVRIRISFTKEAKAGEDDGR